MQRNYRSIKSWWIRLFVLQVQKREFENIEPAQHHCFYREKQELFKGPLPCKNKKWLDESLGKFPLHYAVKVGVSEKSSRQSAVDYLSEAKMNIKYRKSKKEDSPVILDILNSVSGDVRDIDFEQFWVAEEENKIIGCVRIKNINGCFELASLAVLPKHRKQGIGSELMKMIINNSAERPLYLLCSDENINFYQKFGFKITDIKNLPEALRSDYKNITRLPFTKNIKVIAMVLK